MPTNISIYFKHYQNDSVTLNAKVSSLIHLNKTLYHTPLPHFVIINNEYNVDKSQNNTTVSFMVAAWLILHLVLYLTYFYSFLVLIIVLVLFQVCIY